MDLCCVYKILSLKAMLLVWSTIHRQPHHCDQIGRFIGLWETFQSLWQQLICPILPHSQAIFVKVSKTFIFLVKSFLGNFCRHLATFYWSHWQPAAIECHTNVGLNYPKNRRGFDLQNRSVRPDVGIKSRQIFPKSRQSKSCLKVMLPTWLNISVTFSMKLNHLGLSEIAQSGHTEIDVATPSWCPVVDDGANRMSYLCILFCVST